MFKFLSIGTTLLAGATIFVGETDRKLNSLVELHPNEDLIKFCVPIIAGLLGKLIDVLANRKRKKKEVDND